MVDPKPLVFNVISSPRGGQAWRQRSNHTGVGAGVEAEAVGDPRQGGSEENEALGLNSEMGHHLGDESSSPGSSN